MIKQVTSLIVGLCLSGCQPGLFSLNTLEKGDNSIVIEKSNEIKNIVLPVASKGYDIENLTTVFYFDHDSYSIDDVNKKLLSSVATYLKDNPKQKVVLIGNSDLWGPHEYNQALGQKRANAVGYYLESLGVPKEQINAISRGKENPLSLADNEQAQALNRRVEILFEKP